MISLALSMPVSTALLRQQSWAQRIETLQRFAFDIADTRGVHPFQLRQGKPDPALLSLEIDFNHWGEYDEQIDNGLAAVFGFVARAQGVIRTRLRGSPYRLTAEERQGLFYLSDCFKQLLPIIQEYPGLPDAIAVSLMPLGVDIPALLGAEGNRRIVAGATLAASQLIFTGVMVGGIPPKTQRILESAAEWLRSGMADRAVGEIDRLLKDPDDSDEDSSSDPIPEPVGSDAPTPILESVELFAGNMASYLVTPTQERVAPNRARIRPTPDIERFTEKFTDSRLTTQSGGFTGFPRQLHRITTDLRVMSRKVRDDLPPRACVGIAVDLSASMGIVLRDTSRLGFASRIHDAVIYGLHKLGVEYFSFGYSDEIVHVNPAGEMACMAFTAGAALSNSDVAALRLISETVNASGLSGVGVIIADGQYPEIDMRAIRHETWRRNLQLIHVDIVDNKVSPFGARHLKVGKLPMPVILEKLAIELTDMLGLE
jgi:hypothetical protein